MSQAFIVGAVRTPVGRRGGALSTVHPADLGAHALRALLERTGVDPGAVDDVYFGCVSQIGAQTGNIARTAWLSAGLPQHVPGTTVDRQCGSSQQTVHFAAQAVASGTADLVVAGGVEVMSLVPIASPMTVGEQAGMGSPYAGEGWREHFGDQEVSQFRGAELIADKWAVSRADMEQLALTSHQRALAAQADGAFGKEIVPAFGLTADECPRADTTLEKMAGLKTLTEDGRLTAAVSSQIADGAAALLIASEEAVRRHGLTPLARVHTMAVVGSDPIHMLTGPIPATEKVLGKAGLSIEEIDLIEINEAFAPVVLAWQKETGAAQERVNAFGGAIALGHPLGATGARLMTTLVHQLRRTRGRYGLQTMCEGGGMANATVLESC
ncbi:MULTISPECIES: acetyl-CoA C-acetyltransferase [unclassified Streptomyces]|uniref:acetyl-CoA C-acetyltransferase n=1 Tax=unclassified Streptomyces TaxID=2593676 RepID=UPI002DDB5E7C|nr:MULTISPECIES: acetyl-CoA C-acetyltransferase [unclassified Streptomyces]WSA96095.1 acetyl-CoA C-acetyltransferase [Streptomyces sp. NBC_01795]WSB80510.1 acetyl-CoA C-acetyltransferase [Streptomyces sp. NBC_01775]WSS11283.1 acetyl-CoA C-acetyltransferase [Streptomyces sp. NBC_01186]WSS39993.1 acetyl-CoA C-acetyltransferase [Streptomyces sp. NBC_01187]